MSENCTQACKQPSCKRRVQLHTVMTQIHEYSITGPTSPAHTLASRIPWQYILNSRESCVEVLRACMWSWSVCPHSTWRSLVAATCCFILVSLLWLFFVSTIHCTYSDRFISDQHTVTMTYVLRESERDVCGVWCAMCMRCVNEWAWNEGIAYPRYV